MNDKTMEAIVAAVLGSVSNEMLLNEAAGRGLAEASALTNEALLKELDKRGLKKSAELTPETVKSYLAGLDSGELATAMSDVLGSTLTEALGDAQLWEMIDDKKYTARHYVESLYTDDLTEVLKHVDGAKLAEAMGGDKDLWELVDDKDRIAGDYLEANACDFIERLDTQDLLDELGNRCCR